MKENLDTWKKIFKGIEDGKRAFCGPQTVQIDLTDKCNNACIGCWVHSPLVDKKEVFPQGKKELPFQLVEKLINQLHKLGTKEIILSGSGEPFIYPHILEVIELIKSKGIYLNIITNASLLNEKVSQLLVKSGVDLITASIWAGTSQTYSATHPGKGSYDFEYLKNNLKKLTFYKQRFPSLVPHIKIYNVICSSNYQDIAAMVDFAKEVDADSIEFQIIDIIKGKTEKLALDKDLSERFLSIFRKISNRKDFIKWGFEDTGEFANIRIDATEKDFGKIWKNYKKGFTILEKAENIICPKGNLCKEEEHFYTKVSPVHFQDVLFRFFFDEKKCISCRNLSLCFPSKECFIDVKTLNILGVKSFIRKTISSEVDSGMHGKHINSFPCYTAWYYSRILTNGDVIPCCKAAKHPLGNVFKESFPKVWYSPAYRRFRFKAKNLPKNNPYFSNINCIKSCDNWGINLVITEKLEQANKPRERWAQ